MSAQPSSAVMLRPMRIADLKGVMAVELSAYPYPWTLGIFEDCLRIGYCCWVAESDDGIIGYAVMSVAAGEAHLLNLCISPSRQRNGIGRRMLGHMLDLAREHGAETVFLEVRPSNEGAVRLYRQADFVEVGTRRGYYPAARGMREDALVLARTL